MLKKIILFGLVIILLSSFISANNDTSKVGYFWYDEFNSITDWTQSVGTWTVVDNGSSNNVTKGVGTLANLDLPIGSFAFTGTNVSIAWQVDDVFADTFGAYPWVMVGTSDFTTAHLIRGGLRSPDNKLETRIRAQAVSQSVFAIVPDVWYDMCMQFDVDDIKLYESLSLQITAAGAVGAVNTFTGLRMSTNNGANSEIRIDNFRIWSGQCIQEPVQPTNSLVQLTTKDAFNGTAINTFNATIVNATATLLVQTTNGTIFWDATDYINITLSGPDYFGRQVNEINTSLGNQEYDMAQAQVNLVLVNLINTTQFNLVNWTINNTIQNTSTNKFSNLTTITRLNVTNGTYTYLAEKPGYPDLVGTFDISPLDNITIYAQIGFFATMNLIDEATLDPFNISNTNQTSVLVVCADIGSFEFILTNETENITIGCAYTKLRFTVEYDDVTYTRSLLSSEGDIFSQDVYLIDLITTQSVFNSFIINDYVGEFKDIQLYILKNVEGAQIVIHSDEIDVENKMSAYLIENDEYILEMRSSNNPTRALGFYGADLAGGKEITVTTANNDITSPDIQGTGVTAWTYASGNGTTLTANAQYEDLNENTDSVMWKIEYVNETNGTLLLFYNVTILNTDSIIFISQNISNFENTTVISTLEYIISGNTETFVKTIYEPIIPLGTGTMFDHISAADIQWGVIIFLSVVMLMGTIATQIYVNYVVLGLAALASVFGLYIPSIVILVMGLILNVLYHLKVAEKRPIN